MATEDARDSRVTDFLIQAAANALGTVASGVVLGGVAVRLGLLEVNEKTLNSTANYAILGGFIVAGLTVIATVSLAVLGVIEPHDRARHQALVLRLLQVAAGLGVAITTVFWAAVMIASWDAEGLLAWALIAAGLVAAIVILEALRRRLLAS